MNIPDDLKSKLFPAHTILLGYRGSIAHNMYVPNTDPNSVDDIDLMGVYMAPRSHYIGIKQVKGTHEKFIDCWDVVSYEFIKFIRLLLKANPNVLGMLYLNKEHYIDSHPYGNIIIDNKDLFVSKLSYNSFSGYAFSQLKRMESLKCEGYMGKKRKLLVEKYGYDCKNAAHCLRLLTMGIEFLKEGRLNIFRKDDSEFFLHIKRGGMKLEEIKSYAEKLFKDVHNSYMHSTLPEEPDYEKVNKLVEDIVFDYITKEQKEQYVV